MKPSRVARVMLFLLLFAVISVSPTVSQAQGSDAWLSKLDGVRFTRDFGTQKYTFFSTVKPGSASSQSDQDGSTAGGCYHETILIAADRMQQCLSCCAAKLSDCGNSGKCNTLYQNCVANCNSHGETPADWRCW